MSLALQLDIPTWALWVAATFAWLLCAVVVIGICGRIDQEAVDTDEPLLYLLIFMWPVALFMLVGMGCVLSIGRIIAPLAIFVAGQRGKK